MRWNICAMIEWKVLCVWIYIHVCVGSAAMIALHHHWDLYRGMAF